MGGHAVEPKRVRVVHGRKVGVVEQGGDRCPVFDGVRDCDGRDVAWVVAVGNRVHRGDHLRARCRSGVGPPASQGRAHQEVEGEVAVAGVRRAPCHVAQLDDPDRVAGHSVFEDLA